MEVPDKAMSDAAQLLSRQGYDKHGDVRFVKTQVQWTETLEPDDFTNPQRDILGYFRVRRGDLADQVALTALQVESANFSVPRYLAERMGISPENAAMALSMPGRWLVFGEHPDGVKRESKIARKLAEVGRTLGDMSSAHPALLPLARSINETLYGPEAEDNG